MDKKRQEEIIKLLNPKGVNEPCPRCRNPQFELVGESTMQLNQETPIGPPIIPVILVACKNCGYITSHAERVLDPTAQLKF
jgi:predicted nucleic-acid-binding Zn-ribbon protein